jgi:hypothetical protein
VSENLMNMVGPSLAPPVTREPIRAASEVEDGMDLSVMLAPCLPMFADDDAE